MWDEDPEGMERELPMAGSGPLHEGMQRSLSRRSVLMARVIQSKEDETAQLEKFLDWLLDPDYFLQPDSARNRESDAHVKRIKRILSRLEQEAQRWPAFHLNHASADLRDYVKLTAGRRFRRSKLVSANGSGLPKDENALSERILAAALVLRRLRPGTYPYPEIKRTLDKRKYHRSQRSWETRVDRLRKKIQDGNYFNALAILELLYAQFLHANRKYTGYSNSEQQMLEAVANV